MKTPSDSSTPRKRCIHTSYERMINAALTQPMTLRCFVPHSIILPQIIHQIHHLCLTHRRAHRLVRLIHDPDREDDPEPVKEEKVHPSVHWLGRVCGESCGVVSVMKSGSAAPPASAYAGTAHPGQERRQVCRGCFRRITKRCGLAQCVICTV